MDDFTIYVGRKRSDGKRWSVDLDDTALGRKWLIASSISSFSERHIDAAGYATAVRIETGSKLWLLRCDARQLEIYDETMQSRSSFCGLHLRAGDVLYVLGCVSHSMFLIFAQGWCIRERYT